MAIGTIFTLFVVPMFYTIISSRTRPRLDDEEGRPVPSQLAPSKYSAPAPDCLRVLAGGASAETLLSPIITSKTMPGDDSPRAECDRQCVHKAAREG
jgi:hypothetical protein